jgi:hypothetical protein
MKSRLLMGRPLLRHKAHITTPWRENAAVHHSKYCALMSQMGLGRFKTFRQKRLRETVKEPFFEFGYARIAAISGSMPMMFITRVRL